MQCAITATKSFFIHISYSTSLLYVTFRLIFMFIYLVLFYLETNLNSINCRKTKIYTRIQRALRNFRPIRLHPNQRLSRPTHSQMSYEAIRRTMRNFFCARCKSLFCDFLLFCRSATRVKCVNIFSSLSQLYSYQRLTRDVASYYNVLPSCINYFFVKLLHCFKSSRIEVIFLCIASL